MIKVYICAPYTLPAGQQLQNVEKSMKAFEELANLGYNPYNPILNHYQDQFAVRPYDSWMRLDAEWLALCDCFLRLPGESRGCDEEIKLARKLNMPIFYKISELHLYYYSIEYSKTITFQKRFLYAKN
jgi:hypothetical protein